MKVLRAIRSKSGKKISFDRKKKRVYKNKSRIIQRILRKDTYFCLENNEKVYPDHLLEKGRKTRVLKKNNIVICGKQKYLILKINKSNPSLIVKL
jgi:signal recognition particle subunit SEC65